MCEIRDEVSRLVGAATAIAAGRPAKSLERNRHRTDVVLGLARVDRVPTSPGARHLFHQLRLGRDRPVGAGSERLGRGGIQRGHLLIGQLGEQGLAQRRAVRGHQCSCSSHYPKGALGLDRVGVADLVTLEDAEVDGLTGLGGEFLHHRPGLLAYIQGADDCQSHLDQRGTGDVSAGDRLLLDEAVMREHRE